MTAVDETTNTQTVTIDVWSDIMCPFCYIGDTVLQQAIEKTGHDVEIRYHSFQLMPELAEGEAHNINELLAAKKGITKGQAEAMNESVSARASEVGLNFASDSIATNTRPAHRLSHFANQHGKQHELMMRLFRAHFTDGLHVGDHEVLADLASEVGLDRDDALAALKSDDHLEDFENDVNVAREIGIQGVPFFVFNNKYAVSGAQPIEVFEQALTTAAADQ